MKLETELRYANNPYYEEYEKLLIDLSRAMAAGDEDAADAIREEMDRPWLELSQEEVERLNGLSQDLFMIEGHDRYSTRPRETGVIAEELKEAWEHRNLKRVLGLLREGPTLLPRDRVAYLRSRCYEGLGHALPALVFMQYASELELDAHPYQWLVLEKLWRLERFAEAVERAEAHLDQGAQGHLAIQAAAVLYLASRDKLEESARIFILKATSALEKVLKGQDGVTDDSVAAYGFLTLGSCFEWLGERKSACEAYDRAVERDPRSDQALVLRGLLRESDDPEGARDDFLAAANLHTHLLTPYLVLAREALKAEEYEECLKWCGEIGLPRDHPRALALVLEFRGIAFFELGRSDKLVHEQFQQALTLDPLSERIQQNFETVRQAMHTGGRSLPHKEMGIADRSDSAIPGARDIAIPVFAAAA